MLLGKNQLLKEKKCKILSMPESANIGEIKNIAAELGSKNEIKLLTQEEVRLIVEKYDTKFVGKGSECVVFSERDHSKKKKYFGLGNKPFRDDVVVAVDYRSVEDPLKAKTLFYTQRIMSTLFPSNFPRFATSFGDADTVNGVSGTIRQKVDIVKGDENNKNSDFGAKKPFGDVTKVIEMLNLPVNIDMSHFNFAKDIDGNVYYLDKVRLKVAGVSWKEEDTIWNTEAIIEYMEKNNYSETDKRIVQKSIQRLNYLKKLNPKIDSTP